jgi:hypothetical protein
MGKNIDSLRHLSYGRFLLEFKDADVIRQGVAMKLKNKVALISVNKTMGLNLQLRV